MGLLDRLMGKKKNRLEEEKQELADLKKKKGKLTIKLAVKRGEELKRNEKAKLRKDIRDLEVKTSLKSRIIRATREEISLIKKDITGSKKKPKKKKKAKKKKAKPKPKKKKTKKRKTRSDKGKKRK